MSTVSQSIPNLLQGISQQPDNRKRPGQLRDVVNAYPDFALGLLKRPGGEFVARLQNAPQNVGKWFPILRDETEKYIACYADNRFHVWDLIERRDANNNILTHPGSIRVVDMGNHSGQPVACSPSTSLTTANTLNAEVDDTTEFQTLCHTAEVNLARAQNNANRTEERHINFAYEYTDNDGYIEESLVSGVLLDDHGEYLVKEDNVVRSTSTAIPTHIVRVSATGSGLANGHFGNVATTGSASGADLTVDLTIVGGEVTSAIINNIGNGNYDTGETLTIPSQAGVQLSVHKFTLSTERTSHHPILASVGYKIYEFITEEPPTGTNQQVTTAEDAYDQTINSAANPGALQNLTTATTDETNARTAYNTQFNACAIATAPTNTLRIVQNGTGLTNANTTGVATTTTGSGTGLTADITVEGGHVHVANIAANPNANYTLEDSISLTGAAFANAVRITTAGSGLSNGSSTGVATTTLTGSGTGMTVDITISGGAVTAATINAAGSGYRNGDTVSINGQAGTVLTVSIVELEFARPAYLQGANAHDIELLTLNDFTFVVNKQRTVRMRPKLSHQDDTDPNRAQVVINVAANATNYEVLLTQNGSTTTFSHTSGSSGASSDSIAAALTTSVDANASYSATQVGAGIYITSNTEFSVEVRGGATENSIFALTDSISDQSRLPIQSRDGYVVKVVNSEDIAIDDMYVKFSTDGDGLFGTGQWEETIGPDLEYEFDELTMPHQLVRQADNSFTYEPVNWNDRLVGDNETNPVPSFVNHEITHIFFYRNRMGFLSGQSVVLSKAGDLFNFWNTSAQAATQDDPIDISAAGKRPVFLRYAATTAVGLVMYSTNEQFLLTTDSDVLSPTSAKVNSLSTYECDPNLEAVSIGTNQTFVSKTPLYTRVFELGEITADQPPVLTDITNIVPELIPETADSMISSSVLSIVSLGQIGTNRVYQYRFLMKNRSERALSSWYQWDLLGQLQCQFFDGGTYYAVTRNNDGDNNTTDDFYVQAFDMSQASESGFLTLPTGERTDVCLDLFTINPHRTYNSTTDQTRIFLPYDTVPGREFVVLLLGGFIGDTATNTTESLGSVLTPTIEGAQGARRVDINGDYRGRDLIIGYRYDMQVDLPKFYRFSAEQGQISNDDVSSLVVHRIKVKTGLCGPIDYRISITGLEDWTNTVEVTRPNQYELNNVNMQASSTHVVPIYQRNENLAISIIGNTPFPVSLLGVDWEGKLNQRFYRRG